jgi:HEAT repeat protein
MGKRFGIVLAVLFVAFLGVIIWQAWRTPEPVYQGRALSYWLEGYDTGNDNQTHPKGPSPPTFVEANEAIRQIGTNAVPALLQMLEQKDSKFKLAIMGLLQMQHLIKIPNSSANRNFEANQGFVALCPRASNAVPQLIEIFDRNPAPFPKQAIPAILGYIGPPAVQAIPALLRGVTHTNGIVRGNAIFALRQIHAVPHLVVPALIKCLNDPDIWVRAQAVRSLGVFGKDAQLAVPALIQLWQKEPLRLATSTPTSNLELSLDGGIVTAAWGTTWGTVKFFPFNAPDVVILIRDALQSIDPEAAAKADIK